MKNLCYYKKGTEVLVDNAGEIFLAEPDTVPEASLMLTWCPPEAARYLVGSWLKYGVKSVPVTMEELDSMGGIFKAGAEFIRFTKVDK